MLLWMDSKWSAKFTQHIPLTSSQPWPWADNRKSMAAGLCNVAWRIESISSKRPVNAVEVPLLCFASQQPNFLRFVNALVTPSPRANKDAAVISEGSQNATRESRLPPNAELPPSHRARPLLRRRVRCRITGTFGVSIVSLPNAHGLPTALPGTPFHALHAPPAHVAPAVSQQMPALCTPQENLPLFIPL